MVVWYGLVFSGSEYRPWRDFVNVVMNLQVPLNIEKFLVSRTIGGFSRRDKLHFIYLFTSLFPRRCPGIYLSQSYSHMCTKFG
jgi:hypothetical protein